MASSARTMKKRSKPQPSREKPSGIKNSGTDDSAVRKSAIAGEIARQISDRLIEAEKFAATGMIADEIAHEINNSLANIKSLIYILENMKPDIEMLKESIKKIAQENARITVLVKWLLDVYRPNENFMQPVDINSEVEKVLSIAERKLSGNGISVFTDLGPGLPPLLFYEGHVKQMLLSAMRNSRRAMERSEVKELNISTRKTGRRIRIKIEDTGPQEKWEGLELDICADLARRYSGIIRTKQDPKNKSRELEILLPF